MNRRLITQLLIIFITFWSFLGVPLSAYAHDDEAIIKLDVTQAQPGASITIRGSGFAPGDTTTIELMLVGSDRPQVLGTATADDHGDLAQVVALPDDLADGAYEVRVADTQHVAIAPLNIVTDSGDDEEGGQRGEHEPLLAPMPTTLQSSTGHSTAVPIATTTASRPTAEVEPPIPIRSLFLSALAIVVLVVSLFINSRRSR